MDKFFYFSKSELKYKEIKDFSRKLVIFFTLSVIIFSSLLFGIYFLISSFKDSKSELVSLKSENKLLSEKMSDMLSLYKDLQIEVDELSKNNNELRIAADLPIIEKEEYKLGTGGKLFDEMFSFGSTNVDVNGVTDYIENIKNRINFEKLNYKIVTQKLKENKLLYQSIPALKPCSGILAVHGFGMRLHPILGRVRMHEGIDILTNQGTTVVASGGGKIDFVGRRGGLGLCIEIDHGFGYKTVYGHLSTSNIKLGQNISRGQIIAKTGNSGLSSGPHLHYEVHHNGEKLDPMNFIFDDLGIFDQTAKK